MADEAGEKKTTMISFDTVETGAGLSMTNRFRDEQIGMPLQSADEVFDEEIKDGKAELQQLQSLASEDAEALKERLTMVRQSPFHTDLLNSCRILTMFRAVMFVACRGRKTWVSDVVAHRKSISP
jgi:hypothetical protein